MDKGTFDKHRESLKSVQTLKVTGTVHSAAGLTVLAAFPGARIGDLVTIAADRDHSVKAEVIGFEGKKVILMPFGAMVGIGAGDRVEPDEQPFAVPCGESLTGRILDGFGSPIDDKPLESDVEWRSIYATPPDPLSRKRISRKLAVGIKAIDALMTVGEGQRVGLFSGSGVGKSTIIGQIARSAAAERIVIGLIGERGREVREFIEDNLGKEGLARCVVVCSTSDSPPMARYKAGLTATTIAEWFRESGRSVLLLVDSITRLARALREIGLAAGETPARRGFPPSVFARLPEILERSGNSRNGIMTAIYSVLIEAGDMDEPVADEVRGILDGHIVLERKIAQRGLWPSIDPLASISRVMDTVVSPEHGEAAAWMKGTMAVYEQNRDLIQIGAYKKGSDREIDRSIRWMQEIENFLRQGKDELVPFDDMLRMLTELRKKAKQDRM